MANDVLVHRHCKCTFLPHQAHDMGHTAPEPLLYRACSRSQKAGFMHAPTVSCSVVLRAVPDMLACSRAIIGLPGAARSARIAALCRTYVQAVLSYLARLGS